MVVYFIRIPVGRSKSTKFKNQAKHRAKTFFFENEEHFQNLEGGRSQATEFSWTSRPHHPNRYISKPTWDRFRADLTSGQKAISMFVNIFLEKAASTFATMFLPIAL